MARYPYFQTLAVTLTALGEGTVTFNIPNGETVEIQEIRQQSTGGFDVIGIRSGSSRRYSNASSSQVLDGAFFADNANDFNAVIRFPEPIVLQGNDDFLIDFKDTSNAGNTVEVLLVCVKDVPS